MNIDIPEEVTNLLQMGGNFGLPTNFEKRNAIHCLIKDFEGNNNNINKSLKLTSIRNMSLPLILEFINNKSTISQNDKHLKHLLKATVQFRNDYPDIIFTRADKGNVTVALEKDLYITELEKILDDNSTYTKIKKNPINNIEKTLNNFLKRWVDKDYIKKSDFYKL